jgi:hypothetical protein
MPPTILVELNMRAGRRSRRVVQIARIAWRAGHPGGAADAGVLALPRRIGMVLADPAEADANWAFQGWSSRQAVLVGLIGRIRSVWDVRALTFGGV